VLAIATALVVAAGIGILWWQARQSERTAAQIEKILEEKKPDIKAAEAFIARVNYGRGYFEQRPAVLDALHDLAQSFGREDRIWITGFSIRENGAGQFQGRAADPLILGLLQDRLLADPRFRNITLIDQRDAAAESDRERNDIGFAIGFTYVPASERGARP
jgi:hypothetical protein